MVTFSAPTNNVAVIPPTFDKVTSDEELNKTKLVASVAVLIVNSFPKRFTVSPSESACEKLIALKVTVALYNGFELALVPRLSPITGSLLLFGCFENITFPELSAPAAFVACEFNLTECVNVASTFPEKVVSASIVGSSVFVIVVLAVVKDVFK